MQRLSLALGCSIFSGLLGAIFAYLLRANIIGMSIFVIVFALGILLIFCPILDTLLKIKTMLDEQNQLLKGEDETDQEEDKKE